MRTAAPVLEGCDVLPPLREAGEGKAVPKQRHRTRAKHTGRFAMLNAFVDHTLATLLPSDAAVWLVLYRDTTNGIARTAQADIARRAGVSRRTVARALIRLGVLGLVQVVRRGGLNRGLSSYRVHPLVRDR